MKTILRKNILISTLLLGYSLQIIAQTDTSKVLEEITVSTGQFKPQSLKNSIYKIRVISEEQIKAKAALNLTQVLNTELGIRFSNDNTLGVADIQLMGMAGRSIKILLDGVPVIDRNDTRESLNQIDIQSIERIEIVEGPMSVIYGSDALAGVINIITKKTLGTHFSVGARIQEETAASEYSLFGKKGLHLQTVNVSYGQGSFFTNGSFTHNDFRGFGGDPYGRSKDWLPKEQYIGNATIGYRLNKNTFYYRLDGLNETITSKGAINMGNYTAFDQRFVSQRWMHQIQDDWRIGQKIHLNTAASYTDYSRRTKSTRHNFQTNTDELTNDRGEQDTANFTSLFFRIQMYYSVNEKLSIQPGIEFNHNAASGARIEGSPTINDYSFFASAEWRPLDWLNIRPGLRLIKNSIYDAPPIVPALNAKLGLTENIDLRLSYAKGFRAPALRELYFDFLDANHSILGNKNLKAETSNSANGALSWRYGSKLRSVFTLSSFYNVFDNLIDYAADPADPTLTRLFNVERFKTTGISFEQAFLYKQWQLNFGALYVGRYNRLSSQNNLNSEVPQFNWSTEANTNLQYLFKKVNTTLAFIYKYSGARKSYQLASSGNANDVVLTKINDFHWADFTATKTFKKSVQVQAGVKNLFDITNVNSNAPGGGAHSTAGPVPISYGRSYFLGISYQFSKK